MTIKELIKRLLDFNMDAEVHVVVDNYSQPFTLAWGGPEGVTKASAEEISFMVGGESEEKPNG